MKNENFYKVYGWMMNDLHLTGIEKDVFAFLYGFEEGFEGSIGYIAESIGAKKRATIYAIDNLVNKKLIIKDSRKGKTSKYTVAKFASHLCKKCNGSGAKNATNNNKHINSNNKYNNPSSFNSFNQRVYNFSKLEKMIRSN